MRFFALLIITSAAFAQTPATDAKAYVKYDQPVIVLNHVRVIDGTGAPAKEDQTLVISEGKIQSIAAAGGQTLQGAQVLDLTGDTVIPGLVGMHDHLYYPAPGWNIAMYPEHAWSFPRLYLAAGVTTIRTTGSVEPYTDLQLKKDIDAGQDARPKDARHRSVSRRSGRVHATDARVKGCGGFAANGELLDRGRCDEFQSLYEHHTR
jgi:hypothetical protein